MSRSIVNPDKLAGLPVSFLNALDALDATQLAKVQAAFTNFTHFDLLGLPLEARLMIYKFLFASEKNRVVSCSRKSADASMTILQVNKQIRAEALMVLGESKRCVLRWKSGRVLLKSQCPSLRLFRRFDLHINIDPPANGSIRPMGIFNNVSPLMSKLAGQIIQDREQQKHIRIEVNITFHAESPHLAMALSEMQKKRSGKRLSPRICKVMFCWAQLDHLVSRMCGHIQAALPESRVTSNIGRTWPKTEIKRKDEETVLFDGRKNKCHHGIIRECKMRTI